MELIKFTLTCLVIALVLLAAAVRFVNTDCQHVHECYVMECMNNGLEEAECNVNWNIEKENQWEPI